MPYRDMLLGSLLPLMSSSHAPLHSRMTSLAYLVPTCQKGFTEGNRDGHCSLLVLAFARECKLVLRLSIRDLVDAEPLVGGPQETREMALDILNI